MKTFSHSRDARINRLNARERTAFATHNGLYEFLVMPFGLTNSGQSFQRLMGHILRGLEYLFALIYIYIDDIIIFSKSADEHFGQLEEIFKRLREANIKLNPKKCNFVKQRVEYFGHIVTPEEECAVAFDKLKRALVSAPILAYPNFEEPFLLFVNASSTGIGFTLAQVQDGKEVAIAYNGRGLNSAERNYSTTEKETLALIEGIKKFQSYLQSRQFTVVTDHSSLRWLMNVKDASGRLARWALLLQQYDFEIVHRPEECAVAFDKLKRALVSAPILAYPNFKEPFLLFVDASSTGIGFTLAQVQDGKEVAIAFNGRGLSSAERNYSTTEREALALIEGIKKFQPYLQSRQFTVVTDHSSLRWLMNVKDASGRLARWALLLQQYDFEIVHRPGKMHGNADSLSRRPYDTRECNSIQKDEPQVAKVRELQRRDFIKQKANLKILEISILENALQHV
ncbi:Retrovirus-related Pol polyprotein from transposon opus [Stylophora pistillata]|uniref:Retrovirus-related Pol polyprotein from transposon opus n=1 Tax=Stylophora pistillata TaxID=50429 RepID=A0A2B4RG99_STYPI|nr:Retrovirus-related Pol polyprotein from transposon opus [Stylophora pistillata]